MPSETVHALRHGTPLCGFSDKLPRDWPLGHVWVSPSDGHLITCPTCKQKAGGLAQAKPPAS